MSFAIPTFRQVFPEFLDPMSYSDATINFWAGVAAKRLPADRWQDLLDDGTMLFIAHHLAIGKPNEMIAEMGGVPGQVKGVLTSKTVDKVSMSYDTKAATYEDAGFWNGTQYGVSFFQLAMMVGAGGLQI
jgi:hypothetical protein